MIAIDTNVLVLAARDTRPVGRAVHERLDRERDAIRIPIFCIGEFWRVVTHPQAPARMLPPAASSFLSSWISREESLLLPGRTYWPLLHGLITERPPRSSEIFDYQIAALCLNQNCSEIWTFDREFPRVDGLQVTNPLS